MLESRVYVIGNQSLCKDLCSNRQLAQEITEKKGTIDCVKSLDHWQDIHTQSSAVIVGSTTERHPGPLAMSVCISEYREFMRAVLRKGQPPDGHQAPWQPATLIDCDEDPHSLREKLHCILHFKLMHRRQVSHLCHQSDLPEVIQHVLHIKERLMEFAKRQKLPIVCYPRLDRYLKYLGEDLKPYRLKRPAEHQADAASSLLPPLPDE